MRITELCDATTTKDHTIGFLRNIGLLRQVPPICGLNGCQRRMTQIKDSQKVSDGYMWRCPEHGGSGRNRVGVRYI